MNTVIAPHQLEISGTCTSLETYVLHATRKLNAKPNKNAQYEEMFAFHMRCLDLHEGRDFFWGYKYPARHLTPKLQRPAKWEVDFAFDKFGLVVEIDGGIWMPGGGAHSHPIDITRNMLKRNDLVLSGKAVLAFTPDQVKDRKAQSDTMLFLESRGWKRPQ